MNTTGQTMNADTKLDDLARENRRLVMELAETREVLRAIRRGEVDALVSSEADAVYAIQLAALAIDKADTYVDSLALLLKQLCLSGGWMYGEAWAVSSDRHYLRPTGAWYGGCSDAIRLHECVVRLWFDEAAESTLLKALETGATQWAQASDLPPGPRATAVAQCGFQTGAAFPLMVEGRATAVLWLWKRERQERDSSLLLRGEEIIAECAPMVQRKREDEILRFTVNELEAAVRERAREVARLTDQPRSRRKSGQSEDETPASPLGASHSRFLQPILDSMSEGVVIADQSGRVVQCNPAAQEILGEDPPGRISLDLWPDVYGFYQADRVTRLEYEDMPLVKAMHGTVVERMELFIRNGACPEGRTLEMSARPFAGDDGGAPRGAVAVFQDVSHRKSSEDHRLQRALAQRDTLLREVHHRIKNNLAAVVELLRRHTRGEPRFQEIVEQVEPQLRAIATVHGLKAGSDSTVRLGPLIKSVADNTSLLYGAEVRVAVSEGLRGLQLREEESVPLALVLNELLVNARKHGSGGLVEVRATRDGDNVVIVVANKAAPGGSRVPGAGGGTPGEGIGLVRSLLPHGRASLDFEHAGDRVSAIVRLAQGVFGADPGMNGEQAK